MKTEFNLVTSVKEHLYNVIPADLIRCDRMNLLNNTLNFQANF